MYSVFEPSIVTSVIYIFDSFTFFLRNLGLTDLVMVEDGSLCTLEYNNDSGLFLIEMMHGYASVFCSQALVVEWLILTFILEYMYIKTIRLTNDVSFVLFNTLSNFVYNNIVLDVLGVKGTKYFSFFLFLFYVIIFSNVFGLIPNVFAMASNFSMTLFLSSISWLGILIVGLYLHGINFFSSFVPSRVPIVLIPFVMFVEIASYFVRIGSLSLRLFANILAGHILLDTISLFVYYTISTVTASFSYSTVIVGLLMFAFLIVLFLFELIIACLQAYIFVVLCAVYLRETLMLNH
jgi:F-type H+-transporting ATPase subunit a